MFFVSCVCYAFVRVCLFVPCGHLLSWLSFVVYNCEFVTFPLVYWVRCGYLDCIDSRSLHPYLLQIM